jgi:hypothetical protein
MSRTRVIAFAALGIVIPLVLAFAAYSLTRTIGSSGAPSVPGLVHHQDQAARKGEADRGSQADTSKPSPTSAGSQVNPTPSDDHGDRGPGGSDSSGHGGGDDASSSGSSGSSGSRSGGGSGDD